MNLDTSLAQLFNQQMNREFANHWAYEALEAPLKSVGWDGFARFFHRSAKEEFKHYERFSDFLVERNETPLLEQVPQPMEGSGEPKIGFQYALDLEQLNTQKLVELAEACKAVSDEDALNFVLDFLEEQRKSEHTLNQMLTRLGRADGNNAALLHWNHRAGKGKL